jgi:imidazolonepropionase-like amidohydrolase
MPISFAIAFAVAMAQQPSGLKPTAYAIRNARVVIEPGKSIPAASVVIRDGVIESVGAEVSIPPDAIVMDGKGLVIYPGLVDALSHAGHDAASRKTSVGAPSPEDLASESLAATKPDHRKGLMPDFVVAAAIKQDDNEMDAWRKSGFTNRLIAPVGAFLTGQSALVNLSGPSSRENIVRPQVGMHLSFRDAGGGDYPRSLMGHVAHVRQFLLDAGHHQRLRLAFEKGIGRRPPHDPALESIGPLLAKKMPIVIEADTADEIHRALDFAAEFNLKPIIAGGRDAWKTATRLKQERVPVIVRLAFAEPNVEKEKNQPARVRGDLIRQRREEVENAAKLHAQGVAFALSAGGQTGDKPAEKFRANLWKAIHAGLPAEAALRAMTTAPADWFGAGTQLGRIAKGRPANLVVADGDFHDPATRFCWAFIDGNRFECSQPRAANDRKFSEPPKPEEAPKANAADVASEIDADRKPRFQTGGNVMIRSATVLTGRGTTIEPCDILVRQGKIAGLGPNLPAAEGVREIDAKGMFVMPGIIDTHAHFAISGGVNEFSLSVVPEVRVRDVINSEDVQIFRSLAGGVTTARLLHGSANCIGGQDAVIKLKYGKSAKELLVADAPRGVKFALGENVKRSDGRFPNTRMGVEAVLVRAFSEATAYRAAWEKYEATHGMPERPLPPRRDLRLEALADILAGDLKIHCHCYRSDEILMLLRVADRFGIKIKSLQHVLEGYKVAPEIARHGASCSLFADWWAYKVEAFDAIPFAAALMHEAGVSVCLKSDSNELVRHLYQEAAKTIKYGGLSETVALQTITYNAAKQLGLDARIGSIEVGKDADLAIFNGYPLNGFARCEMTLVEGEVYFQRGTNLVPSAIALGRPSVERLRSLPIPANGGGKYVLRNAVVHTSDGRALRPASTLIIDGKFAAFENDNWVGATEIDLKSAHVFPGLIDAGTVLGLTELGSAKETQDYAEGGDFQPDLRASVAVNPDSELIPVTRANGVLTVVTRPTGGFVVGQSAVIQLAGWTAADMVVRDPFALHVDFPAETPYFVNDPNWPNLGRAVAKKQREEKIRRLKELFTQAIGYEDARSRNANLPVNPRLEALIPYARGKRQIVVQAFRQTEIVDAIKLADELKLKIIISGGFDAWKVAGQLKARDIPVIFGPVMTLPAESHDPYDSPFAAPEKLRQAGVRYCIRSAGVANTRNLPYEAAMAVSYGLPPAEALNAITIYPAQILGIADQLGSFDAGKRANLVIADGDILQPTTRVVGLFIDGKPIEITNKQTRLYERYHQRIQEMKDSRPVVNGGR